jgi:hypothetical protein
MREFIMKKRIKLSKKGDTYAGKCNEIGCRGIQN